MTQFNTLNVKLSNSQVNKFKSGIKNGTQVTLRFSLNMVDDSSDETNLTLNLFFTKTQVSKMNKAFQKKLSKTHTLNTFLLYFSKLLYVFPFMLLLLLSIFLRESRVLQQD